MSVGFNPVLRHGAQSTNSQSACGTFTSTCKKVASFALKHPKFTFGAAVGSLAAKAVGVSLFSFSGLAFLVGGVAAAYGLVKYYSKGEEAANSSVPTGSSISSTPGYDSGIFRHAIPNGKIPPRDFVSMLSNIHQMAIQDKFVTFYDENYNPHTSVFGNFYKKKMHIYGGTFECAEAAFQYKKALLSLDPSDRNFAAKRSALLNQFSRLDGDGAFRAGNSIHLSSSQITQWDNTKSDVMLEILEEKFKDPQLKYLLDATKGAILCEHYPRGQRRDAYTDGGTGIGIGRIGGLAIALMSVRDGVNYDANNLPPIPHSLEVFWQSPHATFPSPIPSPAAASPQSTSAASNAFYSSYTPADTSESSTAMSSSSASGSFIPMPAVTRIAAQALSGCVVCGRERTLPDYRDTIDGFSPFCGLGCRKCVKVGCNNAKYIEIGNDPVTGREKRLAYFAHCGKKCAKSDSANARRIVIA